MILRPTKSLATKMVVGLQPPTFALTSTARFGDWYATELNVARLKLVLFVSENARLPIVIEAAPYKSVHQRLPLALERFLRTIEIEEKKIEREISEMSVISFAKSNNRSLTGTLNTYRTDLEWSFKGSKPCKTIDGCTMRLANGICMPLEEKVPLKAAIALFAHANLSLVR